MPDRVVLVNARVFVAKDQPDAAAIAIEGERVLGTGSAADMRRLAGDGSVEWDLGGRRVIPGLVDGHVHAVRGGQTWSQDVHWDRIATLDEGIQLLVEAAEHRGPGRWLAVRGGWSSGQVPEQRIPTREELDAALPANPVYVQSAYEDAVVNTPALEHLELLDAIAADVPLHDFVTDAQGALTGVINGFDGFRFVRSKMGMPGFEEQVDGTREMLAEFSRRGLVGTVDGGGMGVGPDDYHALFELWRRELLPVRVRLFVHASWGGEVVDESEDWLRFWHADFGDDLLRTNGLGEVIHWRCHDLAGFEPLQMSEDDLREFEHVCRRIAERGMSASMHAIRAETISTLLDVWERIAADHPLHELRWHIVHGELISTSDIARLERLGIGLSIQDRLVSRAARSAEHWGEEAVLAAPPIGNLAASGVHVAMGTDGLTAAPYDPWRALHWLVTGETIDTAPPRAPEHRLDRRTALHWYTAGPAWLTSEEHERGTLEAGRLADLAVLDRDYLEVPVEEIPAITSVLTMLGGRVVHQAAELSPPTSA